jgi:uncharacterized membrane protein YeiH
MNARLLLWVDAVGLAAYAVVGAAKAIGSGLSPLVWVVMGVLGACFGGVLRDVVGEQPSVLLRREICVTAAIAAATAYIAADHLHLFKIVSMVAGVDAGLIIRGGAIMLGWRLPPFSESLLDPAETDR